VERQGFMEGAVGLDPNLANADACVPAMPSSVGFRPHTAHLQTATGAAMNATNWPVGDGSWRWGMIAGPSIHCVTICLFGAPRRQNQVHKTAQG
jgi:hypothetical protein